MRIQKEDFLRYFEQHGLPETWISPVLGSEKFWVWPASIDKHHAYEGGLAEHTFEVIRYTKGLLDTVVSTTEIEMGVTAAVWHDFAKVRDYQRLPDGSFQKAPYRLRERHVVGSWKAATTHLTDCKWSDWEIEKVGHAILAHHGRREWGSPVEPQDTVAWALHLADMMSAMTGGKRNG